MELKDSQWQYKNIPQPKLGYKQWSRKMLKNSSVTRAEVGGQVASPRNLTTVSGQDGLPRRDWSNCWWDSDEAIASDMAILEQKFLNLQDTLICNKACREERKTCYTTAVRSDRFNLEARPFFVAGTEHADYSVVHPLNENVSFAQANFSRDLFDGF